jgi:hypothetical protein
MNEPPFNTCTIESIVTRESDFYRIKVDGITSLVTKLVNQLDVTHDSVSTKGIGLEQPKAD